MALYIVSGLPFAGKKRLFSAARLQTKQSSKYIFRYPIVTKESAKENKEQVLVSEEEFEKMKLEGSLVFSWKLGAAQLGYASDILISAEKEGKKIILHGLPPAVIPEVIKKVEKMVGVNLVCVNMYAHMEILCARAKGLDDKFNDRVFMKKVKKVESELPVAAVGLSVVKCVNEGTLEEGIAAFLTAIGFDPLIDIPPKSEAEIARQELATCPANEYLKRVLYPYLFPALSRIDSERPEDPIEMLALHLLRAARSDRIRSNELIELKEVTMQLRNRISREYNLPNRI